MYKDFKPFSGNRVTYRLLKLLIDVEISMSYEKTPANIFVKTEDTRYAGDEDSHWFS